MRVADYPRNTLPPYICSYSVVAPGEVQEAIDAMVAIVKMMRSDCKAA